MDPKVGIQQITSESVEDIPDAVLGAMKELVPEGGDYLIIRAEPQMIELIKQGWETELLPYGVQMREMARIPGQIESDFHEPRIVLGVTHVMVDNEWVEVR